MWNRLFTLPRFSLILFETSLNTFEILTLKKGDCDYFQEPPSFPYIPGGDIAGVVEKADENSRFKHGDKVLCMFEIPRPLNGLAEYACFEEYLVSHCPGSISPSKAACLTSSALTALRAAETFAKEGNRVLVLGASGGVGCFLVQILKLSKVSYIAATSTEEKLVKSLGANRVINYKNENWWEIKEHLEGPFDIIFDLGVGGYDGWKMAKDTGCLKSGSNGGKYVTLSGDEPCMKVHNLWQTICFIFSIYKRCLWTKICPCYVPTYVHFMEGLNVAKGGDKDFEKVANMVDEGKLRVIIDPSSCSMFDLNAVKNAFRVMNNRAAHGKIVIEVRNNL